MTELTVLAFAVWRITHLLAAESGPFHVFLWLRERLGIEHDEDEVPRLWPHTYFGEMFECPYCLSMNVAIVVAVAWFLFPTTIFYLAIPFALSAVAVILNGLAKAIA